MIACAVLAGTSLLLMGIVLEPAYAHWVSYDGSYSVRQAIPNNTCSGTNPKACAFVSSTGFGDIYSKVDGNPLNKDAWTRFNANAGTGQVGANPVHSWTGSGSQISAKSYGCISGYITANAWGGEAILVQGGTIWKDGVLQAHYGQTVASGTGSKSGCPTVTGGIGTSSGTHNYQTGAEFQAVTWTFCCPGLNEVDFYTGTRLVQIYKVEIGGI